jgi:hypothetical protein
LSRQYFNIAADNPVVLMREEDHYNANYYDSGTRERLMVGNFVGRYMNPNIIAREFPVLTDMDLYVVGEHLIDGIWVGADILRIAKNIDFREHDSKCRFPIQ